MVDVKRFESIVRSHRDRNDDTVGNVAIGAFVLASLVLPVICYSSLTGRMDRIDERTSTEYALAFDGRHGLTNNLHSGNSITNRYVGQ